MVQGTESFLFPTYARYPISFVRGEGSRLWDDEGKEYLDFVSGIAVTNLGHVHPKVREALVEQLGKLWHVSNLFRIPAQEELAELLVRHSCLDAVFFCNSGAEANEAAIKLARRYHQKVLGNGRYEIISFHHSFHGRTLATLTATGQDKVKDGYQPLPEGFVYAPYNDAQAVRRLLNDKTCAIMLELVQGEGGVHPAKEDFVREIVSLCRDHGLLLIIDEVQTGMGRTGKLFAYEHYGIEPDIVTLAKGLGNGFPIGAMLGKKKLLEAFGPGSHGSTFGGTPIAATAALAVMRVLTEENIPERAARMGAELKALLEEKVKPFPIVKEIRGKGLLLGIELTEPAADYVLAAQKEGLLVLTAGPRVIRLLPNLLVTREEIERAADILSRVLAKSPCAQNQS